MKTVNRVKKTGEVFTPPSLVKEILDKIGNENFVSNKTYLDNSCGDGAFLKEVQKILLDKGIKRSYTIFNNLFGCDLMIDNAMDAIYNLLYSDSPIEKIRLDRNDNVLKEGTENVNSLLYKTIYKKKKIDVEIYKCEEIFLRKECKDVKEEFIRNEMDSGVIYFNVKIGKKEPFTFSNIVCFDSLKYNFNFGRE